MPMPVQGKTTEELRAYVNGLDPITKRPFMQEIIEGLTGPLTEEDLKGQSFDRSTPRFVEADTEDRLQLLFHENHWTDGLPVILPTEERVAEMLGHTSHKPDEVVGRMSPTGHREAWEFTVEKVAINAVMAGAPPEALPVILTLATMGSARGSSSGAMAKMVVLNGPVRHELKMNAGIGAMGPYNRSNATIGRAYGLLSQNGQGGSVPGLTYMGSQGNGYGFTNLCVPENEERSPWEPFHVEHGFKAEDSVVSVFNGCLTTSFTFGLRRKHWRETVKRMLLGMEPDFEPVLVLDPLTAHQFIEIAGLGTKADVIDWCWDAAQMPAGEYWDLQLSLNYRHPRAVLGEEPYASMLAAKPEELIHIFQKKNIKVVVVGGETNAYWRIIGANYGRSRSIDAWR
ncbi:MAG: hypothetical protein JO247_08880 [Chloroflexi bacterium]|nr:hypothetical protein [Chloroflexota bacterium]